MHLTALLKLHQPSRRKRDILDLALNEYADLMAWLLTWAEDRVDDLAVGSRYVTKSGRVMFPSRRIEALLPPLAECSGRIHSSLRDAARAEVGAMLSGYLALREGGHEPGYPAIRTGRPEDYINALETFAAITDDVDEAEWSRRVGQMIREAAAASPVLSFPRMRGWAHKRNAALLRDPETERYFALLFLLAAGDDLGAQLDGMGNLVPVGEEEAETFQGRTRAAILCPLELGKWHEKTFMTSGALPKAAKLWRNREGDYYLAVSFEMPPVEPVPLTGAVMTVVESAPGLFAYAIAKNGSVLSAGDYCPEQTEIEAVKTQWRRELRRRAKRGQSVAGFTLRRLTKHSLHAVANDLVKKAVEAGAEMYVQPPGKTAQGRRPITRMRFLLDYKAQLAGLPAPRWMKMWSGGDVHRSRICSACGEIRPKGSYCGACGGTRWKKEKRKRVCEVCGEPWPRGLGGQRDFLCPACGHTDDHAQNTARVIAVNPKLE